ncbi:unnamed protein product [marine sediment metagenome]|uniref:Uncharacterized protein n=1 Tax=marine sediment metagenome TaxID=412755 RepID=X1VNF5_9ZZZZ
MQEQLYHLEGREQRDDDGRRSLVNQVLNQVREMPSSSWQKRYLEEIKTRWPNLIVSWDMKARKEE